MKEIEGVYYSDKGLTKEWIIGLLTKPIVANRGYMETLDNTLVGDDDGDVLWCIHEIQWNFSGSVKWIGSYRLLDIENKGWGFTKSSEITPPEDYTCPLAYLQSVKPAHKEWRHKVYQYHAEKACKEFLRRKQ